MSLALTFGALANPIEEQLKEQQLPIPEDIKEIQHLADSVVLLNLSDVLTDTEARIARQRIVKVVKKAIWM